MDELERHREPQITVTRRDRGAPGPRSGARPGHAAVDGPAPGARERAWNWEGDLSEPERTELAELRLATAGLREEIAGLERALDEVGRREREVRAALEELAAAGAWGRRRVLARLRERALL
jgi:hypothetical protein